MRRINLAFLLTGFISMGILMGSTLPAQAEDDSEESAEEESPAQEKISEENASSNKKTTPQGSSAESSSADEEESQEPSTADEGPTAPLAAVPEPKQSKPASAESVQQPVPSVPSTTPEKPIVPIFPTGAAAAVVGPPCVNDAESLTALYTEKILELEKFLEKSRGRLKPALEYEKTIQQEINAANAEIAQINASSNPSKNKEAAKKQKELNRLNKQLATAKKNTQSICKEISADLARIGAEQVQNIRQAFRDSQTKIQNNGQLSHPSMSDE
ncbi:MAG: hypothetical protein HY547_05605 [Elusimicrobia bacterium]|nr:hypothetical protein [Elusimicrobiota bacterium]